MAFLQFSLQLLVDGSLLDGNRDLGREVSEQLNFVGLPIAGAGAFGNVEQTPQFFATKQR